ncbi:MAG: septal ring lytic transglycosylase RlpA family protein [Candidatus Rokubacteria bacterium]|nr:septal ring lytic transglycosylase RlpA family protein [Candidatus Rokubacteria bacterium]
MASWYGHPHHGRKTANGETFDMNAMTAAHRTLPFGTWLLVENLNNGRSVRVRVNDRGPYVGKRILDVSRAAGVALDMMGPGIVPVRIRLVEAAAAAAGTFYVQVGAFSEEERAVALRQSLARAGVDADVVRAESGGQVVHRVRTGRFATRGDADAAAAKFTRDGYTAIVVAD